MTKRHVYVRGEKIPVERKKMERFDGLAYKRPKRDRRPVRRRIVIARRLRGVKRLSTLVHEALHIIDMRLSEQTVLRIEEAMVELVIDNPEVFHNQLWE